MSTDGATHAAQAAPRRGASLAVIALALIVAGGLLFLAVQELLGVLGVQPTQQQMTPAALHVAAEQGDMATLTREIDAGANVDDPADESQGQRRGMTPLMLAAMQGHADAAAKLVDAGADTNAQTRDNKTPIMFAAGWGNAESVQNLIDSGARIDARSQDGWTATMFAAARGTPDSLAALLEAGADVATANKWGQTALIHAVRSGDLEKVRALLAAGANVNTPDREGQTPLIVACESLQASTEVLAALLEAEAQVNHTNAAGITALMRAADAANIEKVQILLAAGADTTKVDAQGLSAIDWARARDDETGESIAQLIEAGN